MFARSSPRLFNPRGPGGGARLRSSLLLLAAFLAPGLALGTDPPTAPGAEPEGGVVTLLFTIDSGGGTSSHGETELVGTIGQPDVGVATAGSVSLIGGFWGRSAPNDVFADGFESGDASAWSTTVP